MTLPNRARIAPALVLLVLAACGGDDDDVDGSPTDGADADASVEDGAPPDGGVFDGGPDGAADAAPDAAPDAGSPFVCDPVAQTGCADGEKCDLAPTGTFGCVADGTLGEMARCDPQRPNACVAGFTCRDTNFDDFRCARLCNTNAECRTGDTCTSQRTTGDGETYLMCATVHVCQPFVQDCVDPEDVCALTPVGAFCLEPGTKTPLPDGSRCEVPTECRDGSSCLDIGQGLRCVRLCDPDDGAPACVNGDDECSQIAQVGPQPIGVCD